MIEKKNIIEKLQKCSLDDLKEHADSLKKIFRREWDSRSNEEIQKPIRKSRKVLHKLHRMFEVMLLFIRVSRDSLMNDSSKYFFTHDQLNYALLTPFYIANMIDIKENNVHTWGYLKDNFSVIKTEIPFMSIGSNHAMEQENKNLKVSGGIIGLTQKSSASNRFCLSFIFRITAEA